MTLDDLKQIAALVGKHGKYPRVELGPDNPATTAALLALGAERGRQVCPLAGEILIIEWARLTVDGVKFVAQWSHPMTAADLPEHVAPVVDRVLDGARTEAA